MVDMNTFDKTNMCSHLQKKLFDEDGKLYFHSALNGHKVDAIRKCDKALVLPNLQFGSINKREFATRIVAVRQDVMCRN
jgi:hypothetical protein